MLFFQAVYQQFNVFGNSPTLKFRLHWSPEPAKGMVERPRPLMPRDNCQAQNGLGSSDNNFNHGTSGSSHNHRRERSRISRQSSSVSSTNNHTTSIRSCFFLKKSSLFSLHNTCQLLRSLESFHLPHENVFFINL